MSTKYVVYEVKENGDEHVHEIVEGFNEAITKRNRYLQLANEASSIGIQEKEMYEYLKNHRYTRSVINGIKRERES
jgi:hypothetical protein